MSPYLVRKCTTTFLTLLTLSSSEDHQRKSVQKGLNAAEKNINLKKRKEVMENKNDTLLLLKIISVSGHSNELFALVHCSCLFLLSQPTKVIILMSNANFANCEER